MPTAGLDTLLGPFIPESREGPADRASVLARLTAWAVCISMLRVSVSFLLGVIGVCGLAGVAGDGGESRSHMLLIRLARLLASLLAVVGSIRGISTSFHGLRSLPAVISAPGGRFSVSSSSPRVSREALTPAPAPGRCSTRPACENRSWRSLMDPSNWTDSRLAADRATWRCLGLRRGFGACEEDGKSMMGALVRGVRIEIDKSEDDFQVRMARAARNRGTAGPAGVTPASKRHRNRS